mgnify:CR=1 FL=1
MENLVLLKPKKALGKVHIEYVHKGKTRFKFSSGNTNMFVYDRVNNRVHTYNKFTGTKVPNYQALETKDFYQPDPKGNGRKSEIEMFLEQTEAKDLVSVRFLSGSGCDREPGRH